MATMFNLTKVVRINGIVTNVENLGYGDKKATIDEAKRVIDTTLVGYDIREKGNRIIATLRLGKQAIKVFLVASEMHGDRKRYVRKSVHKNGDRQTEVVFEGTKEDCFVYIHHEVARYAGLDEFQCEFTDNGSAHVEYTTKKGTKVKVNYLVKLAA